MKKPREAQGLNLLDHSLEESNDQYFATTAPPNR